MMAAALLLQGQGDFKDKWMDRCLNVVVMIRKPPACRQLHFEIPLVIAQLEKLTVTGLIISWIQFSCSRTFLEQTRKVKTTAQPTADTLQLQWFAAQLQQVDLCWTFLCHHTDRYLFCWNEHLLHSLFFFLMNQAWTERMYASIIFADKIQFSRLNML